MILLDHQNVGCSSWLLEKCQNILQLCSLYLNFYNYIIILMIQQNYFQFQFVSTKFFTTSNSFFRIPNLSNIYIIDKIK